jgi:hypothetical protein
MTNHSIKYGTLITILLIVYFLVLRAFGLHTITVLSAFNGVIFGFGIFQSIKSYKDLHKNFKYEKGFRTGLMSGFFASVVFGIVMAIYIYHIDADFSNHVMNDWNLELNNASFVLVVSVIIMGLATSFILTLAFMQLLKESWNSRHTKDLEL